MKKNTLVSVLGQVFNAEILSQMTEKDIVNMVVEEIQQVREANAHLKSVLCEREDHIEELKAQVVDLGNHACIEVRETTDIESGAPKLPGGNIEPQYSAEVMNLLDCLGIQPINPLWHDLCCNDHSVDGRDDFAVWFEKVFYHQNAKACQAFLAKLKEVALSRKSCKWEAFFQRDHLHLRRTG